MMLIHLQQYHQSLRPILVSIRDDLVSHNLLLNHQLSQIMQQPKIKRILINSLFILLFQLFWKDVKENSSNVLVFLIQGWFFSTFQILLIIDQLIDKTLDLFILFYDLSHKKKHSNKANRTDSNFCRRIWKHILLFYSNKNK